jgi:hypothetical protein
MIKRSNMKKLKMLTLAAAVLLIAMNHLNAQVKSVLIKGTFAHLSVEITTIKPNYEITKQEYKKDKNSAENDFLVLLKKEMDKWLKEGYELTELGVSSYTESLYSMFYVLTKKE